MRFLDSFPNCVFQTFKDREEAKGYAKVFLEYDEKLFKDLNAKGCGIYFTPNGFKGARKKENLVSLNAIYADIDLAKEGKGEIDLEGKKSLVDALKEKVVPNFIIDTKNGLQPIWLLSRGGVDDERCRKYTNVICGIIEWSKKHGAMGDQVKDVTRVLRLPNYYHMKGDPYLCRAFKQHENKYTLDFLAKEFPFEEKKVEKPIVKNNYRKNQVSQEIDRLDFQELVIRAFASVGRVAEFDDKKRLILDGRLTGTFQGKKGSGEYLASTSHEPFEGNRITVVADILQITNKEARAWIVDEYNLKELVVKEKIKKVIQEQKIKPKIRKSYYSWGTKDLTESFAPIKSDTFAIVGAGYGVGKTTFCVDMALKNVELGHKVLYLSLEMSSDEIHDQFARKYSGITIPEEIYGIVSKEKARAYEKRIEWLKGLEGFTLKGFKGTEGVTWDCLKEMLAGDWDLIFVDNFNLIQKDQSMTQFEHEGWLSSKFVEFATTKQVPLVVVHHYSKGGAREKDKTGYSMSGNSKIMNDAHRIVLLNRKQFDQDENPTKKDLALLRVRLDKGRAYDGGIAKNIYFYKGSFYDDFPEDKSLQPTDSDWWNK